MSGRAALHVPLFLALAVFLGPTAALFMAARAQTEGAFSYPLDDAFIHMAIARNIAEHGVYGVTAHGFTSASSSIGWPVLLAAVVRIVGDRPLTPLLLNVLAGAWLALVVARAFAREGKTAAWGTRAFWVVLTVALAPLPTVALLGMEHTLHAVVCLLFVQSAARWLATSEPARGRTLALLAGAATLVRYESLFLLAAFAAFAAARRRHRAAAGIVAAGAGPVVLFGLYSKAHGWPFLPASVLLKGTKLTIDHPSDVVDVLFGNFLHRISTEPHMIGLLLGGSVVLVLAVRRAGLWSEGTLRLAIALAGAFAHVELGKLGWFFRYEAYLVVLLLASIGLLAVEHGPPIGDVVRGRWRGPIACVAIAGAALAGLGPLFRRALQAAEQTATASRNIFEQQVQTARLVAQLPADTPVAVNDIGAVAYFSPRPIVDLIGLATLQVARAKRFDIYRPLSAAEVEHLAAKAPVAIVYDDWVSDRPPSWTLLARWRIDLCRSCYRETVAIYATRPEEIPRIDEALRAHTPKLPPGVRREGLYLEPPGAVPGTPEHRLSVGDVVRIGTASEVTVSVVTAEGRVDVRGVGSLDARGLRVEELQASVTRARDTQQREAAPSPVDVTLVEPRPARYLVTGRVPAPRELFSREPLTVTGAIARAGATTPAAAYVLRRTADRYAPIDIAPDALLSPLDIVVVR